MQEFKFPYDENGKWKYYKIEKGYSKFHERDMYEVVNKLTGLIEHQDVVLISVLEAANTLDSKLVAYFNSNAMKSSKVIELKH